jgi:Asp-tRNA(Asn)/Glu-tRNA(Gln) amidotransferase A subunit family amidase
LIVQDAIKKREYIVTKIDKFFDEYEFLITPTVSVLPWIAGQKKLPEGQYTDFSWNPFTYPFNWSNQSAISVPCGSVIDEQGFSLPIGLQIIRRQTDKTKQAAIQHDLQLLLVLARRAMMPLDYPTFAHLRYELGKCSSD